MKTFRIVVLFRGNETGIVVTADTATQARRCVAGRIVSVTEVK